VWDWVAGKLLCDIPWTDSSREAAAHIASQHGEIEERLSAGPAGAAAGGGGGGAAGGGVLAGAARDGPAGSSLYSLSLSRSANPARPERTDPWESAFLLAGGNSIHEAKIYCVSSVFATAGLHGILAKTAPPAAAPAQGTLWASAMYRVRRRASLAKGTFGDAARKAAAAASAPEAFSRDAREAAAGGGGGGGGAPAVHADEAAPRHHLAHIPRALLAEGFAAPKGGAPAQPLVGTVKGFPKALYSVHWAPGGQGFAVACGDGAYVLDLNLPHGAADWVGGKRADLCVTVRPPAAP